MSKMNYEQARKTLSQTCEHYLVHNKVQLDAIIPVSPVIPEFVFFERVLRRSDAGSGFYDWISCEYDRIVDGITLLNLNGCRSLGTKYYEKRYPPCENKLIFLSRIRYPKTDYSALGQRGYVNPKLLFDRLTALNGLLNYIMVKENKELDFENNLQEHISQKDSHYLFADSEPFSIKIYSSLKELRDVIGFINDTLPKYHKAYVANTLSEIDKSFPMFEGYIKGIAVLELKSLLDDATLSDEEAVKAVGSQLRNEGILEILGKNRQSETEHILKMLSVALIAVGIGIVPTLILAAKRLYDTGGTSINFFKPLSKNLCEDVQGITHHLSLDENEFETSSSSLI